jgi:hypothetical protein
MNSQGIFSFAEVKNGKVDFNIADYSFPNGEGNASIFGKVALRYWGNQSNLIVLVDTIDGEKLRFAFWRDKGYRPEDSPQGVSARDLKVGQMVRVDYQKGNSAKITRVRGLEILMG